MSEIYTVVDIAGRLGVPVHRVRYAVHSRFIDPVRRIGTTWVYTAEQVEQIRQALLADRRKRENYEKPGK